ncbi:hypothetical protein [Tissierella carlieri]|uniref:hypothetical protein n=1 Tax=Tissierella carlieri TaxID=689904 RepID=UPI001C0F7BAC|nr:hypothetical protein [Tissierella carlieri]
MKKTMKKIITAIIFVTTIIFGASSAYANLSAVNEARSIQLQADSLVAAVDENSLMLDAMENVIDYSVPLSVRESIVVSADFSPMVGVAQDAIELEVNSTVQKVGEIVRKNGDIANMYVAVVAASEVKVDDQYKGQHGIKAWAYVYWIDNLGTKNELYAAAADWDPKDKVVNNRQVRYGTTDVAWLLWLDGPTIKYPTENYAYYEDSSYSGLTLRCQTKIDVVNVGTVTCNVGSRVVTR